MKSKIIAIIIATVIFVSVVMFLFLQNTTQEKVIIEPIKKVELEKSLKKVSPTVLENVEEEFLFTKTVYEGDVCDKVINKAYMKCGKKLSCMDGACMPNLEYTEIVNPKQDQDYYDIAAGGPYKNDYILHVDRLVVSEKLYVWIGNKKKPIWFKARRESELRPYEIEIPKGNSIRIKLSNRDKLHPPEFRGKIYLTKP